MLKYERSGKFIAQYFQSFHARASREHQQRSALGSNCYGIINPDITNEATHIRLKEEESYLLQLGPRFIYDDPKTASRRRTIELATLLRKHEARFHKKKS
ncbi:hypothetical protein I4U23_005410 [Adineta vaga]|nr:hypothetical protein I4U23_005410 [Adineta vaga]